MSFDKRLESLTKNSALDLQERLIRLPINQAVSWAVSWSERMSRAKALSNRVRVRETAWQRGQGAQVRAKTLCERRRSPAQPCAKARFSVLLHFCCGWSYSYRAVTDSSTRRYPPPVTGRTAARWSLSTAAIQPARPWHDRQEVTSGGQVAHPAAPPHGGAHSESELLSIREQVIRLGKLLSGHAEEFKW